MGLHRILLFFLLNILRQGKKFHQKLCFVLILCLFQNLLNYLMFFALKIIWLWNWVWKLSDPEIIWPRNYLTLKLSSFESIWVWKLPDLEIIWLWNYLSLKIIWHCHCPTRQVFDFKNFLSSKIFWFHFFWFHFFFVFFLDLETIWVWKLSDPEII